MHVIIFFFFKGDVGDGEDNNTELDYLECIVNAVYVSKTDKEVHMITYTL